MVKISVSFTSLFFFSQLLLLPSCICFLLICIFYLQVFDSNGSFLSYVNTSADPLYGPQGIAITPEGTVVVADSGNHCIKVYKYLQ